MSIELDTVTTAVIDFIKAVNTQSKADLARLLTLDHEFVDSIGNRMTGREEVLEAWATNFRTFPDYKLTVSEMFVKNDFVVMLGRASGTFAVKRGLLLRQNYWEIPAAWKATVEGFALSEWRVYADNEPVRQIMEKAAASAP